jgi:phosphoribosylamine---glycine ligase
VKVLVIGGGGREHALAWKIRKSQHVNWVGCAPGNGGTDSVAENIQLDTSNPEAVVQYAVDNDIALTVIGPEAPLAAGIVDAFPRDKSHMVFGPTAAAARLESSKRWSKEVMASAGVPTAGWRGFTDADEALQYVRTRPGGSVVKASGLAAGKGVYVCDSPAEAEEAVKSIMIEGAHGSSGNEIIVEERLEGTEASLLAICDGKDFVILVPARDHKRVGEGDTGPNTGGMGAIAPNSEMTDELVQQCADTIFTPMLRMLQEDGTPYKGVLYAGIMLTQDGPKVLEFNVRFGDPETQVVLPLLNVDLIDLMLLAINERLGEFMGNIGLQSHEWQRIHKPDHCASVVLASAGYPGSYEKGKAISGLPNETDNLVVFHAGTKRVDGGVVTSGGRVLNVTGLAATQDEALQTAYTAADQIQFDGKMLRCDIGGFKG